MIAQSEAMIHNQRRSNLEIAAHILRIRGSQAAVMRGANLSYAQTHKYLSQLAELALIEPVAGGRNERWQCRPTLKGQEFIELVEKLKIMLES